MSDEAASAEQHMRHTDQLAEALRDLTHELALSREQRENDIRVALREMEARIIEAILSNRLSLADARLLDRVERRQGALLKRLDALAAKTFS